MMRTSFKLLLSLSLLFALLFGGVGCSASSLLTTEGVAGTALGTIGGTGVGYFVGEQLGKKTENMALAGGIGAGLGMLVGGMLHERNVSEVRARQVLVREAQVVNENQREIDSLREKLTDSSTWGRGEVKSWNERYMGESYDIPYEGFSR